MPRCIPREHSRVARARPFVRSEGSRITLHFSLLASSRFFLKSVFLPNVFFTPSLTGFFSGLSTARYGTFLALDPRPDNRRNRSARPVANPARSSRVMHDYPCCRPVGHLAPSRVADPSASIADRVIRPTTSRAGHCRCHSRRPAAAQDPRPPESASVDSRAGVNGLGQEVINLSKFQGCNSRSKWKVGKRDDRNDSRTTRSSKEHSELSIVH